MLLWDRCLTILKDKYPNNIFEMYFRALKVVDEQDRFVIYAPSSYWAEAIKKDYLADISAVLVQESEGRIAPNTVHLVVDVRPGSVILSEDEQSGAETEIAPEVVVKKTPTVQTSKKTIDNKKLNPAFTFSLFVEGKSNQLASEICREVLVKLGESQHNPLFIYGATGLGKTHLMHAVGNALLQANPSAKVMYITTEDFMRGYSNSVKANKMEEFKEHYRTLDLLLVDDIHLLKGGSTMTEFFYTFNSLLDNSKQIILTSDRYPKQLTDLDDRLVSRLSWGLSVEVEPPDIETRIEILLKKAEVAKADLPRNCALFIAQQVTGNVRELEGALNKILAMARFQNRDIDFDIVKSSLKDQIAIRSRTISADNIKRVVSEYFRIAEKDLVGPKRTRNIARPRQLAMGLTRELTGDSYPEIGMAFGGRDHSTVMHACDKVQELIDSDAGFADDYKNLLKLLQH